MYDFEYLRPDGLSEAVSLLRNNSEGKLLAGGMTLIPALKHRLIQPSLTIDLAQIDELKGITRQFDGLHIGAMTRHFAVATSMEVQETIPALAGLAGGIGDPQVRNRGTIGGSIANNDPSADYPAAVLALGATIITDRREISCDDFFVDLFETRLELDEVIRAVHFPIPLAAAYAKFPNPASRYAIVGVFVACTNNGVRVAVTGAGSCVFRSKLLEEALNSHFHPGAVDAVQIEPDELNKDIHASPLYRAQLIKIMAKRAVETASPYLK